ncbi:MAG: hypothetical protein JSR96_14810 [Proteobacteria bacterium]|nr:hypothetical protein [Pseudomonadota bacterium]
MRPSFLCAALGAGVLAGGPGPAAAALDSDWPVLASDDDGDCRLTVTGNGKVFLIAATGLGAGEAARYQLANGTMRPIDWAVTASDGGRFARYYVPFRAGDADGRIEGGQVQVSISTAACTVSAAFPWRRTPF